MSREKSEKKNNQKRSSKLGHLISSIIIAIAAWGVVAYTTDPDVTKRINGISVEIKGGETLRENGFITVDEEEIPKVSLKLKGKRSDLIKAIDRAKVVIDVSSVTAEGEYSLEGEVQLPTTRLSVDGNSEVYIPIKIEKYESKEIPVKVVVFGDAEDKLVQADASVSKVTIYGAKSSIDYAEYASVEVKADAAEDGEADLPYNIVCREDAPEKLRIYNPGSGTVNVKTTVYKPVEVTVKATAQNVVQGVLDSEATEVSPKKVTVGIKDGEAPESVSVALPDFAGEGEYEVAAPEGVYLPPESKKVKVKPVWISPNKN